MFIKLANPAAIVARSRVPRMALVAMQSRAFVRASRIALAAVVK
jgi:hypothetical protein